MKFLYLFGVCCVTMLSKCQSIDISEPNEQPDDIVNATNSIIGEYSEMFKERVIKYHDYSSADFFENFELFHQAIKELVLLKFQSVNSFGESEKVNVEVLSKNIEESFENLKDVALTKHKSFQQEKENLEKKASELQKETKGELEALKLTYERITENMKTKKNKCLEKFDENNRIHEEALKAQTAESKAIIANLTSTIKSHEEVKLQTDLEVKIAKYGNRQASHQTMLKSLEEKRNTRNELFEAVADIHGKISVLEDDKNISSEVMHLLKTVEDLHFSALESNMLELKASNESVNFENEHLDQEKTELEKAFREALESKDQEIKNCFKPCEKSNKLPRNVKYVFEKVGKWGEFCTNLNEAF